MSDSRQRKIGALLSYAVIIINILISIFYTPFLTNKLGQSEYGLYSMVSSILSYLTVLDFGFGSAIIIYSTKYRTKNKKEEESNLYGMFIIIYIIIGIIASLIGLALYFNVNLLFENTLSLQELNKAKTLMGILTFNLAVTFPLSVFTSIINSYEKFIFLKITNIIMLLLKPFIMIPLLLLGFKSITLVLVITLLNILSLLLNVYYCYKKLKIKISFNNMKFSLLTKIFAFSIWIFLNNIVDKINWSLDNFLLGTLSGTVAVSVYAIASQINQLYISFSTAISGVMLPKITNMVETGASDNEFTDILIKTGRIQLMIIGLILSGFIIFGKPFINLWVGYEYKDAYYIALALMLPMVVSLIQNSVTSIVQAKNKHKFMSIVLIFTSILNIIISIPLIKKYGGLGAAIGTGISLIIGNIIIKNIYYYKIIKIDVILFFKKIFNMLIYILFITLISYKLIKTTILTNWISLITGAVIYTIIYFIGLLFFTNDYEKNILKSLIVKIKGVLKCKK